MKKKREREPDLIEFKVNYTLDDDFPVEKYFMAYNSTDALKSFAQSCAKHLSEKTISDIEMSCFTTAFATPNEPYIEKPEIIPLPKPIPELDESELEIIEEVNIEEPLTKLDADTESLAPPDAIHSEVNNMQESTEEIDISPQPIKVEKVDPRKEHAELKAEYSNKVNIISAKNKKILDNYENLITITNQRIIKINQRIKIVEISEYFKWSDKWIDVPSPSYSLLED